MKILRLSATQLIALILFMLYFLQPVQAEAELSPVQAKLKRFNELNRTSIKDQALELKQQRSQLACALVATNISSFAIPEPETLTVSIRRKELPADPAIQLDDFLVKAQTGFPGGLRIIGGKQIPASNTRRRYIAYDDLTAQVLDLDRFFAVKLEGHLHEYRDEACADGKQINNIETRSKFTGQVISTRKEFIENASTKVIGEKQEYRSNLLLDLPILAKHIELPKNMVFDPSNARLTLDAHPEGAALSITLDDMRSGKPRQDNTCKFLIEGKPDSPTTQKFSASTQTLGGLAIEDFALLRDGKTVSDTLIIPINDQGTAILGNSRLNAKLLMTKADGNRFNNFFMPVPKGKLFIRKQSGSFQARISGSDIEMEYLGGNSVTELEVSLTPKGNGKLLRLKIIPVQFSASFSPPLPLNTQGERLLEIGQEYTLKIAVNSDAFLGNIKADLSVNIAKNSTSSNGFSESSLTLKGNNTAETQFQLDGAGFKRAIISAGALGNLDSARSSHLNIRFHKQSQGISRKLNVFDHTLRIPFNFAAPALTGIKIKLSKQAGTLSDAEKQAYFFPNNQAAPNIHLFANILFGDSVSEDLEVNNSVRGLPWLNRVTVGDNILKKTSNGLVLNGVNTGSTDIVMVANADNLKQKGGPRIALGLTRLVSNKITIEANQLRIKQVLEDNFFTTLDGDETLNFREPIILLESHGPSDLTDYTAHWQVAGDKIVTPFSNEGTHWQTKLIKDIDQLALVEIFDASGKSVAALDQGGINFHIARSTITILVPDRLSQDVEQPITAIIRDLPEEFWEDTVCRWSYQHPDQRIGIFAKELTPVEMQSVQLGRCNNKMLLLKNENTKGDFTGIKVELVNLNTRGFGRNTTIGGR